MKNPFEDKREIFFDVCDWLKVRRSGYMSLYTRYIYIVYLSSSTANQIRATCAWSPPSHPVTFSRLLTGNRRQMWLMCRLSFAPSTIMTTQRNAFSRDGMFGCISMHDSYLIQSRLKAGQIIIHHFRTRVQDQGQKVMSYARISKTTSTNRIWKSTIHEYIASLVSLNVAHNMHYVNINVAWTSKLTCSGWCKPNIQRYNIHLLRFLSDMYSIPSYIHLRFMDLWCTDKSPRG